MAARETSNAAAPPLVRLVDVHKSFGTVEVLCGISYRVPRRYL